MKPEHVAILTECLRRMREHAATPRPPAWQKWNTGPFDEQTEHGPEYAAGDWFGEVAEHERQRYRRALADLERGGLLVMHARWGRRLSHVRLTAEGIAVAEGLLAGTSTNP